MSGGGGGGSPVKALPSLPNPLKNIGLPKVDIPGNESGLVKSLLPENLFDNPANILAPPGDIGSYIGNGFTDKLAGDFFGGGVNAGGAALPPQSGNPAYRDSELRSRIKGDATLDDIGKNDLLAELDRGADPGAIQQKYSQILDPETNLGKGLLSRKERTKIMKDTPGLKAQTSFFSQDFGGLGR